MNKHTRAELEQWKALPLDIKIRMTEERIRAWINHYGEDGVFISFSGGKDSTVLLDIVRKRYPNVKAVFFDTGLEYPEIREFVKTFDNVDWVKPKKTFKDIIMRWGYPFISKDVASALDGAIKTAQMITEKEHLDPNSGDYFNKLSEYCEKNGTGSGGSIFRLAKVLGILTKDGKIKADINYFDKRSNFTYDKYRFCLKAPFKFSAYCCEVMKKSPSHIYSKKHNRMPITAQMTVESQQRTQVWMRQGCNAFDIEHPISNPMSFWTEQDVLQYIKDNNLRICSLYGELCTKEDGTLYYNGLQRTGCMFCGFGCARKQDERFVIMKRTHPKIYEYIMKPVDEGGLGYREVIDWLNLYGNLRIRY